jgi:hypothetical protein
VGPLEGGSVRIREGICRERGVDACADQRILRIQAPHLLTRRPGPRRTRPDPEDTRSVDRNTVPENSIADALRDKAATDSLTLSALPVGLAHGVDLRRTVAAYVILRCPMSPSTRTRSLIGSVARWSAIRNMGQ